MENSVQNERLSNLLYSCLTRYFGVKDEAFHQFIEANAEYIDLASGETLIHQGDLSKAVYFLLSGHLRAIVDTPDGKSETVGEIGRGETVGELALFTGKPRGANVLAIRDSIAVKIPSEVVEKAIGQQPQVALKMTKQIIERFERMQALAKPPMVPVNVTLLPISEGIDVDDFVSQLTNIRNAKGNDVCVVDSKYVRENYGALKTPDVAFPRGDVSQALSDLELKHAGLFFVANPNDSAWCQTAIHHSDEVILIGDAKAAPDVTKIEETLLKGRDNLRAQITLVLMHDKDTKSPQGTAHWLKPRNANRHFHVRKNHKPDFERLDRILTGTATGLVLAGGGARGIAHLGIMEALGDAGIEIDFVGGTSAGAIMGSFVAMGVSLKNIKKVTRDIFTNSPFGNISGDFNLLPILSLIKGERAWKVSRKAVIDNAGADIDMEDSWKTFFVVASNFSTHQEQVLTHGNFTRNLVASFSIPGLMPPCIIDGHLMFDGGSFNNFPVDHMRRQGATHIIGIDLLSDVVREHAFEKVPSSLSVIWDKIRFRNKQKYKKLPTLPVTLLTASVVASIARQKDLRNHVDILFQPNARGVSLLDWKKYDVLFSRAKVDAKEQLSKLSQETLDKFK
ncbi:MAG: patatin-like phospholipase family protein [Nitratireductor sp.]